MGGRYRSCSWLRESPTTAIVPVARGRVRWWDPEHGSAGVVPDARGLNTMADAEPDAIA